MDIVRRALSWCWFLLRLKGTQSADAHVQKIPFLSWFEYPKTHVNRKWVAHPEHVNKCCGVRQILQVTITIIDPRLYQSTQFLCTTWNSPMNLFRESQTLTNTSVQRIIRGEKRNKVWIIVKGSRSRKLNLPNIYNLSSLIFQICTCLTMICSEMLLIHFSCYFGQRRQFLLLGAYTFPTSSFHVPFNTVFNKIWLKKML